MRRSAFRSALGRYDNPCQPVEPNGTTIDDDRASSGPAPPVGGLPDFLTVVEAARLLRIGRTSAYVLAQRWLSTDGCEGLPVVRVGRQLRVPRRALEGLAGGELTTAEHSFAAPAVEAPEPSTRLPDDDDARTGATPHTTDRVPLASPRSERSDDRGTQAPLFPIDR